MHKAIGSRKDFSRPDEDSLLAEYKACVEDLLAHDMVQKMDNHVQHCDTSRLQHKCILLQLFDLPPYGLGLSFCCTSGLAA